MLSGPAMTVFMYGRISGEPVIQPRSEPGEKKHLLQGRLRGINPGQLPRSPFLDLVVDLLPLERGSIDYFLCAG